MKLIARNEVLGVAEYEAVREPFRTRVIAAKRTRRVALGPQASCVFENRDTALLQIQEMLRTERITREAAILHEIETYNQLVPRDHELSATVMIEVDEKAERERFLYEAKGLDRCFFLLIDGHRCVGEHDVAREEPDRTTAVHYLKFALTERAEQALRDVLEKRRHPSDLTITVAVTHPRYTAETTLAPALVADLAADLA